MPWVVKLVRACCTRRCLSGGAGRPVTTMRRTGDGDAKSAYLHYGSFQSRDLTRFDDGGAVWCGLR